MFEYGSKFEEDLIKSQRRLDDSMGYAYEQRAEMIGLLKKLVILDAVLVAFVVIMLGSMM